MKTNSILLWMLFALSANSLTTAKAQVDVNDSLALADLYNSTNGSGWNINTNWLTTNSVSTWYGITVTGTRVTYIQLGYNKLTGTIPASIGNLVKLNNLVLPANRLSGKIPSSIGSLVNLNSLSLGDNNLSGSIPSSFGNLVNLNFLALYHNHLSGSMPSSFGNLVNLQTLYLYNNQLSGEFPHTLKKLTHLTYFDISYNLLLQSSNVEYLSSRSSNLLGKSNNNHFTFHGAEFVAQKFPNVVYAPQAHIPIHRSGNILSVDAGGTLSNNTYNWFRVGSTENTVINGDSTFQPEESGRYYARVTNSIAIQLILYSDTVDFTMSSSITTHSRLPAEQIDSKVKHVFEAYPSPVNSVVQVQVNGTATIILTNSLGKVIFTKAINNTGELNISSLANGVYYVQNKTTGEVRNIVVSH